MVRELPTLLETVSACRRCRGMGSTPILSNANGPGSARVLFVGEAPGRLGAALTGRPFDGDTSGRRFESLLAAAGLAREGVFITNAVLCLPLSASGNNRRPTASEQANCRPWLQATIKAVNPGLVVAMGSVALTAVHRIEAHTLAVRDAGSEPLPWFGRRLAAVYHPSALAQVHRSWEQQLADWQGIGAWLRSGTAGESAASG